MQLKKTIVLSLIGLIFLSSSAFADQEGDYAYTVSDGSATITGYTGAGGAISIPATLGGYPTVAIGDYVFSNNDNLTSVTIPGSVTTIGIDAFRLCTGVTSLTIAEGVTTIGNRAFARMYALQSVDIPASVTSIGTYGLFGGTSNTGITVDADNPNYSSEDGVLYNKDKTTLIQYPCGKAGALVIPASVTSIGIAACELSAGNITSITFMGNVETIAEAAFEGLTSLTSITFPASLTSIGDSAFYGCSQLTSMTLPKSLTNIGNYAFSDCSQLTSVTIPGSVTTIGTDAFRLCTGVTSLTISEGVTTIGDRAFARMYALPSVYIPASVTSIGMYGFYGGTSNTAITVNADNLDYSSVDGVLYNKDKTTLIQYPCGKAGAFTIPASVTSIGIAAFELCSVVTSITFMGNVETIAEAAFEGLTNLTSISLPASLTSIGDYAFYGCSGLTGAYFYGDAPTMGAQVFDNSSSGFTVYCLAEATGFTNPWYGYPAVCLGGSTSITTTIQFTTTTSSMSSTTTSIQPTTSSSSSTTTSTSGGGGGGGGMPVTTTSIPTVKTTIFTTTVITTTSTPVSPPLNPECVNIAPSAVDAGVTADVAVSVQDIDLTQVSGINVTFGCKGLVVNSVNVNSSTQITVNITAAEDAPQFTGNVTLTGETGTTNIICENKFTVNAAPPGSLSVNPSLFRNGVILPRIKIFTITGTSSNWDSTSDVKIQGIDTIIPLSRSKSEVRVLALVPAKIRLPAGNKAVTVTTWKEVCAGNLAIE